MSVLEETVGSEELLSTGHPLLPRVNLLPPEIEERRRFRRVQYGLGGAVLASIGVVGIVYLGAVANAKDAEAELQDVTAQGQAISAEQAQYADVTAVYARAEAAEVMLTQAMGEEVRFSGQLHRFAVAMPDDVWLENVTFAQAPTAPTVGDVTPGIGTVTLTGIAYEHDDVATWLESLAAHKGYAKPYLTSSDDSLTGERVTVDFVSTVVMTPDSLSRRYATQDGR